MQRYTVILLSIVGVIGVIILQPVLWHRHESDLPPTNWSELTPNSMVKNSICDETKKYCRFEMTAPKGNISSPNYPSYYSSKSVWEWHILAKPGHRIQLVFEEFQIELAFDSVAVYSGDSMHLMTLGTFCGSELPLPIRSSSNQLYVLFKSGILGVGKGFSAHYETVSDSSHTDLDLLTYNNIFCDNAKKFCKYELTAPKGNISSPNYPSNYGNNTVCPTKNMISSGRPLDISYPDCYQYWLS